MRLAEQEMWTGRNVGRVRIHSNCLTSPRDTLRPSVRDTRISHLAIYIYIYVWQGVGQSRIGPATSILTNLPIAKIKHDFTPRLCARWKRFSLLTILLTRYTVVEEL